MATRQAPAPGLGGVRSPGRAAVGARTLRTDRWWAYPAVTFAALAWYEALTELPRAGAPDEAYAAVGAEFPAAEIAAVTFAIVAIDGWSRLAVGLGAEVTSLDGLDLPGEPAEEPGPGRAAAR